MLSQLPLAGATQSEDEGLARVCSPWQKTPSSPRGSQAALETRSQRDETSRRPWPVSPARTQAFATQEILQSPQQANPAEPESSEAKFSGLSYAAFAARRRL